jgi:hypothetical protein
MSKRLGKERGTGQHSACQALNMWGRRPGWLLKALFVLLHTYNVL